MSQFAEKVQNVLYGSFTGGIALNLRSLLTAAITLAALVMATLIQPVFAEMPPVRIAVVPGGGSGMEQDVVDGINNSLSGQSQIALSTVNPDWFAICNILDKTDIQGQNVRVNGTVTIKTTDGHVVDTVSTMVNKQDFSLTPGTPVNRVLVDNAVREVIRSLVERSVPKIMNAVQIEMVTREKVVRAYKLADQGQVAAAIALLNEISQDSPQFKRARRVISELRARGSGRSGGGARKSSYRPSQAQPTLNQAKMNAVVAKQKALTAEQKALELEKSLLKGK